MIYVERNVLSQEQCDELIQYFWDSKDKHDDGKVQHFVGGEYQGKLADKNYKNCTQFMFCLLYTSPSPRDRQKSRMPSSA